LWPKNFFGKILPLGNKKKEGAGNPARAFWGEMSQSRHILRRKNLNFP
jgi:hypothetical protein